MKTSLRGPTKIQSTLVLICTVLLLSLGLSACGDDADSGNSGGDVGAKIKLAYSAWPGWFPWGVAEQQGLFKKNGLNVELKYFDSYTDSLTALSNGSVDANSQTLNDTLSSVAGGAKEVIVLTNDNSTGNDQIIARSGINAVADLKGKTVAVEQGTVDHYLLLLALQKAGLSEKDITLKPLVTDAAAAAFKSGKVDAVGAFQPFADKALELSGSKAVATSKDFPGAIPDHLVVSEKLRKDNPKVVQALVKSWFDTLAWIKANKNAANEIMAKRAGVSVADYAAYDAGTTIFTLDDNLKAFTPGGTDANLDFQAKKISDFLVSTKLVDAPPKLDGLLDPTFVKALQQSGGG